MNPRTPKRRALGLVAAAAAALSLMTACSSGSTTQQSAVDPAAPVTLTWWTGQADEAEQILEGLAADFHTQHPNVTINVSAGAPTTDDLLQKVSAGFAADQYPDITYAYGSWAGELASSGRTLDITQQVSDPAVRWEELPEAGRKTATVDDKVIGFPALVDNLALMYNKKLFDQAGLAYPTNDWTWDQFRAAAQKLNNPAKKVYGFGYPVSGGEDTTWHLWPLLWQRGGAILTPDGQQTAFASDAGVGALDFLRTMAVDDKTVYLDQTDEKYGPLFVSGQIGMIISGPWQLYDLVQAKTKYGVAFLPAFNGEHTTVAGPDLWALLDHRDANRAHWAYEFTKWVTDPEQDAKFNLDQGNLPLRASEKALPAYRKFQKEYPGVDVFVDNFANTTQVRPTVEGYVGLSQSVGDAISATLQGAKQSRPALEAAAKSADAALAGR